MDNFNHPLTPDVPAHVALMVILGLWGFLSCSAVLSVTGLGP
jgi:hypothetical protein